MRQCPTCGRRYLTEKVEVCEADNTPLQTVVLSSARDRLVGAMVNGRWEIDAVIGDGGMGVVYRAIEADTGHDVAIKVLRSEYTEEEDAVQRFQQEAEAVRRIRHPNVVEVYEFGALEDGSHYIVMEFLPGRSLSAMMRPPGAKRRSPVPWQRAIHIAQQLCDALGYSHRLGVVHRDLKPDNVQLIERDGDEDFVKILDFGIAKVQGAEYARTRTGSVFGTPHYMAPEQASGARDLDARTDQYALGCVLYELVCGRPPFEGDNLMTVLTSHVYTLPDPPSKHAPPGNVPPELEAVIYKSLMKPRDARYPNLEAMREDLFRIVRGERPLALDDGDVQATIRAAAAGETAVGANASGRMSQVPTTTPSGTADQVTRALQLNSGLMSAPGTGQSIPPVSAANTGGVRTGWIAAGFALLAVVSIGGGALVARGGGHETAGGVSPSALAAASASARASALLAIAGAHASASARVSAMPTGRALPSGAAAAAVVRVDSVPTGAEVFLGGARLGVTPAMLPRPPAGQRFTFVLAGAGRLRGEIEVTSETPTGQVVTLQASRSATGNGPAPSARPAPSGSARGQGGARELLDPWER